VSQGNEYKQWTDHQFIKTQSHSALHWQCSVDTWLHVLFKWKKGINSTKTRNAHY
jgi:hypothetical protein